MHADANGQVAVLTHENTIHALHTSD